MSGQTVTVRSYVIDRFGDRTLAGTRRVPDCWFAPRSSGAQTTTSEVTDRALTVRSDAELYLPRGERIESTDEFELDDTTKWEVDGRPETWTDPFTGSWPLGMPAVVVPLKRITG